MLNGQIIKIIAGFYDIKSNNKIYRVRGSGNLRNENIIPLVGDFANFSENGLLINIKERKNCLIRPKVANVDQVVIVTSLTEPKFSSLLLDKFLAIIESQDIKVIIFFTKSDLVESIQPYLDYKNQNYECYLINNKNKVPNLIKKILENKLSVFTGQSGVGKSTTINNILNISLETNVISKSLGRGKHTTRVVEIHSKNNINIIDTPGFSSINISLTPIEFANSFHDFKIWSKKCKFRSCLHDNENNCFVKEQLKNKKLLKSRYENYIKILTEIKKSIQYENN